MDELKKVFHEVPTWAWWVGAAALGLVVILKLRSGSSASSTSGTPMGVPSATAPVLDTSGTSGSGSSGDLLSQYPNGFMIVPITAGSGSGSGSGTGAGAGTGTGTDGAGAGTGTGTGVGAGNTLGLTSGTAGASAATGAQGLQGLQSSAGNILSVASSVADTHPLLSQSTPVNFQAGAPQQTFALPAGFGGNQITFNPPPANGLAPNPIPSATNPYPASSNSNPSGPAPVAGNAPPQAAASAPPGLPYGAAGWGSSGQVIWSGVGGYVQQGGTPYTGPVSQTHP